MSYPFKGLPLFPDLLEQLDQAHRNRDFVRRGHAVWCIEDHHRSASDDCGEHISLAVIYDDERFDFPENRTGKFWIVEIKHHFSKYVNLETGWGSSRRTQRKLRYSARIHEKRFLARDEAIEMAMRVAEILARMNSAKELSQ